jgi:hypothetical protein
MGGAMAEEEVEESGSERSGEAATGGLDPEKGPTSVQAMLLEMADKSVTEVLLDIVKYVAVNVKLNKHVPSMKLLLDLATKAEAGKEVKPEDVESLAEKLTRDLAGLDELTVQ